MEEIDPHSLANSSCAYCPYPIKNITIPEETAKKLNDSTIPPTHIEIECPECENVFYWTQDKWDFSFDNMHWSQTAEINKRKTSPGKNVYVPKEEVIKIE
jgi:uncharacterized protein with PIN domain